MTLQSTRGQKASRSSSLQETFRQLAVKGEKALIAYIMAGDPSLEDTESYVLQLADAGADIIELGVPFSDPIADGPIIQAAAGRALRSGTTLKKNFGNGVGAPSAHANPPGADGLLQYCFTIW